MHEAADSPHCTYKLLPGLALGLRNARLDALDLAGPEARHGSLVLWAREVGGSDGALELGEGRARRGLPLAGGRSCRHLQDVNCREA
jgi:hypothetical protein